MIKKLIIVFLAVSTYTFSQTSDKRGTIKVKKVEKTIRTDTINTAVVFSADTPISVSAPLTIVEQMPVFSGGNQAMYAFIQNNITYPEAEKKAKIQGTVYVTFIVEADGSISNVKALKGVTGGPGLSKEAVRIVKLMPDWTPGKQNGRAVPVQSTLPIRFSL